VPTLDDCYPWQPGGCEWTLRYLWRWISPVVRLDVIVLALLLVYLFAVVIHVYYRYNLARRETRIDSADSKKLVAVLNIKVGNLKSIALTAPCLGLAGTCIGILDGLAGGAAQKDAFRMALAMKFAVALIPTALAIPVAALATASYNYLCTRMDLLAGEVFREGQKTSRHFPRARRFPPTERFAELPTFGLLGAFPAFGLLVALGLTILVKVFMPGPSFPPQTGFYVELASARCEYDGNDTLVGLHITNADKLFLNFEPQDWNTLPNRLSQIYSMRQHPALYLLADSDVPFQTVADALDTVENVPLDIQVRLVTAKAMNADCLPKPVKAASNH
jgi:biopolymer transport protein ExbD